MVNKTFLPRAPAFPKYLTHYKSSIFSVGTTFALVRASQSGLGEPERFVLGPQTHQGLGGLQQARIV